MQRDTFKKIFVFEKIISNDAWGENILLNLKYETNGNIQTITNQLKRDMFGLESDVSEILVLNDVNIDIKNGFVVLHESDQMEVVSCVKYRAKTICYLKKVVI